MTEFILVRHGTPDYSYINKRKFRGFGNDLAPLSEIGEKEILKISKEEKLKNADIIISSPHTRTMQTAAIIAKELNINIKVEVDLMEWIVDKSFMYDDYSQVVKWREHYEISGGKNIYEGDNFEEKNELIARCKNVLKKYNGKYKKVIVVTHGMIISALTGVKNPKCGQIINYKLEEGEK